MEYAFTPLLCICLSIMLGGILGSLLTMYVTVRDYKDLKQELDKFRALYFNEVNKWKNKYDQDDYEAY